MGTRAPQSHGGLPVAEECPAAHSHSRVRGEGVGAVVGTARCVDSLGGPCTAVAMQLGPTGAGRVPEPKLSWSGMWTDTNKGCWSAACRGESTLRFPEAPQARPGYQ